MWARGSTALEHEHAHFLGAFGFGEHVVIAIGLRGHAIVIVTHLRHAVTFFANHLPPAHASSAPPHTARTRMHDGRQANRWNVHPSKSGGPWISPRR